MSLEDAFRGVVRDEIRRVLREELQSAIAEIRAASAPDDGYLSVEKAAAFAEVHADTIRQWVKSGRLPEHRAGRELRLRRSELHRFLECSTDGAGQLTADEVANQILSKQQK